MQHYSRLIILVAVAVAVFPLVGCDAPAKPAVAVVAATKKPMGTAPRPLKLTEKEAKYLGIEFAEVTKSGTQLVVPYNTLLYSATGLEWVFISPEPNTFIRTEIKVEKIVGETVFLAKGPAVGTKLVTYGAAELYGIEFGVGK